MLKRRLTISVLTSLVVIAASCTSGGNNPSQPSVTVPARVSVAGTIGAFFYPYVRFGGSTVSLHPFANQAATSATTSSGIKGEFTLDDVAPGTYALRVVGSDHVDRAVKVEIVAGGANDLGIIDVVERKIGSFEWNEQMVDEYLHQSNYSGIGDRAGTARWTTPPTVYVDVDSLTIDRLSFSRDGACPLPFGTLMDTVRYAIEVSFPEMTDYLVSAKLAQVRPSSSMPAARTPGTILVRGGSADGVAGTTISDANAQGELQWSVVELGTVDPNTGGLGQVSRNTLIHELGHVLGKSHSSAQPTVMAPLDSRTCQPSQHDRMYGEYQYRRPPGTRSPDDTTAVQTIVGKLK